MSAVERTITVLPDQVWAVLADGWLYPVWVVGASRMREVDDTWPAVGSSLHHSVGSWPALIDDTTTVTECQPGRRLRLQARAWPAGEAYVDLQLSEVGGGTRVRIEEDITSGPGRVVPAAVRGVGLRWRNVETLRRLAYVAERR